MQVYPLIRTKRYFASRDVLRHLFGFIAAFSIAMILALFIILNTRLPRSAGYIGVGHEASYFGSLNTENLTVYPRNRGAPFIMKVFIAKNESEWRRGLMNTSKQALGYYGASGMLFAFPNASVRCFWMENTSIPLEQSWIDNGTVAYVYDAQPYSTGTVCYTGEYVLEIATGKQVSAGDAIYPLNLT